MDFRVPLKIGIDGLKLADTLDFDFEEKERLNKINNGKLMLIAENSFPIDASFKMYFLDEKSKVLESVKSSDKIKAGKIKSDGKVMELRESKIYFDLDDEEYDRFRKTKRIVLESLFNSVDKEMVNLYNDYKLKLTLVADFNYQVDTKKQ